MLVFFTSCNDDDPFVGADNFISSFTLTRGEQTIDGMFQGDTILMYIPEGFLNGESIIPNVECSENSVISPDPSSIKAWDEEQNFYVTSYSGIARRYRYVPYMQDITESGFVTLNTQSDVEAFGAKGVTRLDGNLIIGKTAGRDTITSLAPLASLRSVTGNIVLNKTCKPYYISGLDNLQEIGGSFEVNSVDSLWTIVMPALAKIGNSLYIQSGSANELAFPALVSVGGDITLASAFTSADFSALQRVGGDLALSGTVVVNDQSFQSLSTVNGSVKVSMNVNKLKFPELKQTGGVEVTTKTIQMLYCPLLERIMGTLSTVDSPTYELSFPALKQVGTVNINSPRINQYDFSHLETVDGNFNVTLPKFELTKLGSLKRIGGDAAFNFKEEDELSFPLSLKEVGGITVATGYYKTLNLKGIEVGHITLSGNTYSDINIIADDVFNGKLVISNMWSPTSPLPTLTGFKEIGGLTISNASFDASGLSEIIIRINGDFEYSPGSATEFSLDNLTEVTGNLYIYGASYYTKTIFRFPKLDKIGGNARISIYSDYTDEQFPALESIGGDFALHSGFDNSGPSTILYPSLKRVGGTLTMYPQGYVGSTQNDNVLTTGTNTTRTNLDFLSGLESIGGFRIINHSALISYEGLKKAITTCPRDRWQTTGNLYNPTYEDLTEKNQWTKPQN